MGGEWDLMYGTPWDHTSDDDDCTDEDEPDDWSESDDDLESIFGPYALAALPVPDTITGSGIAGTANIYP